MKVVVQRVRSSSVKVDDKPVGSVGRGLMVLVGIHRDDTGEEVEWISDKIGKMRIFDDKDGQMNLSVEDVEGEILLVPQFTLYGDARKGNRPSYIDAADPDKAEALFDYMVEYMRENRKAKIATGVFGAHMQVELVNDGPVTIILEK